MGKNRQPVDTSLPEGTRDIGIEISLSGPDAKKPAETLLEVAREIYAATVAMHQLVFDSLDAINKKVRFSTQEEKVDIAFALQQAAILVDDMRKEIDATKKKQAVYEMCKAWAVDPMAEPTIHGKFASGSPRIVTLTTYPKFKDDPAAYNYIMDYLGIPQDMRDKGKWLTCEGEFNTEVVKINWPGFQDWINMLQIQGQELPPEVLEFARLKQWKQLDATLRKKRDLLTVVRNAQSTISDDE